jgi:hypothetical protein
MSNPTIFLDIDGVLNSLEYAILRMEKLQESRIYGIDPYAIERFQHIFTIIPEAEIVISSTWRKYYTIEELRDEFVNVGFKYPEKIVGYTPNLFHDRTKYRGHEIQQYCEEHNIENYVIIDDSTDMLPKQKKHFVNTHNASGLTFDDVIEVIHKLSKCKKYNIEKNYCRPRHQIKLYPQTKSVR